MVPRWSALPLLASSAVMVPLACAAHRDPGPSNPPAAAYGAAPQPAPGAPYLPPPLPPATAVTEAPGTATAAPGGPACDSISDCFACTSRPDCGLCTYLRGCMSKAQQESGSCLSGVLHSPSQCDLDPVKQRAKELAREVEARRAAILASTQGMTPAGQPFETRLEKMGSIEIPVAAGMCHILVWSLAPDAKPADVRISLAFVTQRSSEGGLTGFDKDARLGTTGLVCSSQPGKERFRVVDRYTYAEVPSSGTGGLSFVLFTRPRAQGDPDDIGSAAAQAALPPPSRGGDGYDGRDCAAELPGCLHDCRYEEGLCKSECPTCYDGCEQGRRSCERRCYACR